jgi:hypothetical protein
VKSRRLRGIGNRSRRALHHSDIDIDELDETSARSVGAGA